jgi:hypothetical protein
MQAPLLFNASARGPMQAPSQRRRSPRASVLALQRIGNASILGAILAPPDFSVSFALVSSARQRSSARFGPSA